MHTIFQLIKLCVVCCCCVYFTLFSCRPRQRSSRKRKKDGCRVWIIVMGSFVNMLTIRCCCCGGGIASGFGNRKSLAYQMRQTKKKKKKRMFQLCLPPYLGLVVSDVIIISCLPCCFFQTPKRTVTSNKQLNRNNYTQQAIKTGNKTLQSLLKKNIL